MKRIRVAFIKYAGLTSGGTEKYLQIIAANLPKERFEVTFFWCHPSPQIGICSEFPPTSEARLEYMKNAGVRLAEFRVGARDLTTPTCVWRETNFWEVFRESDYDLIMTSLVGHKEYPFTKIKHVPIIETIAHRSGSDNQYNIARVLHLCRWSADAWVGRGGDPDRVQIVSLPIEVGGFGKGDLRNELDLAGKFVFGMHQRPSDDIYSPIALDAYSKIESDDTAYMLMGGGRKYREQAKRLGLRHAYFLDASGDSERIGKFLRTLNVFAHCRSDGEVNSQAMAEAMFFSLPIVSHPSRVNNGHIENMGNAGVIANSIDDYAAELSRLFKDQAYYQNRKVSSRARFNEHYELNRQISRYSKIFEAVVEDPFPHPFRRMLWSLHWRQNIRVAMVWIYLKARHAARLVKSDEKRA